ncbi:tetratricopeptide repeat protein [Gymnodinialimonas hymeniacidonis]|uniref:tetratricopeptide repeat protein n=1 Tax=Gymnodinialimonas hymeniacidonis TaxID=3126508 RepID=UPI0034C62626
MSNTDSFIEEVSEEVRRDRLFSLFRRWGWLAILVVVAIVGAAAWFEWQSSQQRAESEAFGDALLAGLESEDPEARIAALSAIETPSPEVAMILALLAAGEEANSEDTAAAAARLREAAEAPGLPRRYVDLALLKAQMMDPAPEDEARLVLERLAEPGAPYSALAEEQLALVDIRAGNLDAGLDRLRSIENSAAATAGLQQRAAQLIVSLESGAVLVDAPVEEEAPEEEAPGEDAPVEDEAVGELGSEEGEPAEEPAEADDAAAEAPGEEDGAEEEPAAAEEAEAETE